MAADTSSSLTSTSHTLTAAPMMASDSAINSDALALLNSLRPGNRHAFLQPSAAIPTESLNIVKDTLEAFAGRVGEEQQARLKEGRKRKRGVAGEKEEVLKLRKVYVEGFETGQVWEQAKRIIQGVLKYSETALEELAEKNEVVEDESDEGSDELDVEDDSDVDVSELDEDDAKKGLDYLDGEQALEIEGYSQDDDEDLEDDLQDDNEDDEEEEDDEDDDEQEEFVEDPNGLNDGFFSIDEFNRETQWFEDQDAKGDPNTDLASDDEEIDWNKDYMKAPTEDDKKPKRKSTDDDAEDDAEDDDDDDEAGPTFGDIDLDAPEGDSEDEAMNMDDAAEEDDGGHNANDVYFKDFFAPPPRKSKGGKPKKKSVRFEAKPPAEEDVERAMADVRRDLFDDDSEGEESDEALSDVSAGDPKARRSAHERRQAKLAEEIRKLEAASVAKREWTLSGEAAAVDRPVNSLLEHDLDFEHVGKPVPVITPEVSEAIEDLIKRRILAQEFDEVVRRRPDAESVPAHTRRGLVELDDTKPNKSLAEVYEEEHVKNADPDAYISKSDEKVQREEKEVEAMWRDVCGRLDALSSWHYKPKPAAPSLSVVADVATVTMEDAQPSTSQGVAGGSSRMAPQEIYKAGADNAAAGEVVSRSGIPVARQEMSREDKTRRRRRNKERVRKAGGTDAMGKTATAAAGKTGSRAQMQRDTMAELKKGGVRVINRKGEITDVDGKKTKAAKVMSSGSFKL